MTVFHGVSKTVDAAQCDAFRAALQRIADMDPGARRADDLGMAARIARAAIPAGLTPAAGTSESSALKQVLDALRLGRIACEWAGKNDEAEKIAAAFDAARSLADGVSETSDAAQPQGNGGSA